jgi:uncharacterized membrane protein
MYTNTYQRGQESKAGSESLATALGWFSIGLGLAELTAPRKMARLIGAPDSGNVPSLMRAYGMRELAAGVGILTQPRPAGWMWSRVAGDLMDLATLGSTMASSEADRARMSTATVAVLGVTALDVMCAQKLGMLAENEQSQEKSDPSRIVRTTTVNRSVEDVYQFWRNFENLPRFMRNLESVRVTGDRLSTWRAKAPFGTTVEWEAELVDDEPNALIGWRSLPHSDIQNCGTVRFQQATGRRGTVIRVELRYTPPGGQLTATAAKLFMMEPGRQVEDDLRRFKQVIETGEVVHSDASIHRGMHPGQPPKLEEVRTPEMAH